jgi:predicted ATPase
VGSLDALHYVGRRWTDERTPVLLLLSLRTEALATTPTLSEWLATLPRAVALTRLELGPLTAEDTLHFVHDLAIGTDASAIDTLAQWLYAETGGQPLFVVETLRALLERELLLPRVRADRRWGIELPARWADAPALSSMLPPGVRDVIHGRLSRLAPATRELLSAGSVLGQGFTFEQVCRVAGLSEHEALGAVDEVLRANVVREAGTGEGRTLAGGYTFAHDKIRRPDRPARGPVARAQIGEAEGLLRAGQAFVYRTLEEAWDVVLRGDASARRSTACSGWPGHRRSPRRSRL